MAVHGAFVGQDVHSVTLCNTAPQRAQTPKPMHRRSVGPTTRCSAQTMSRTYTGARTAPPKVGGHHFLHIDDFSKEQLVAMLSTARTVKDRVLGGDDYKPLAGKTMAMIFTKPSMRTRVSFETVSSTFRSAGAMPCTLLKMLRSDDFTEPLSGLLQTRRPCIVPRSRHNSDWQA